MDILPEQDRDNASQLRTAAAIADPDRLSILGLLARREITVEGLAIELGLDAQTIGGHLAVLGSAGLVSTRKERSRRLLSLRREALNGLADWCKARQLNSESSEPPLDVPDGVRPFFTCSRLSSFPARQSKKNEVLRVLVQDFAPEVDYSEADVNQILLQRYPDFATLRRALIDEGLLTRNGGIYRRPISPDPGPTSD